MAFTHSHLGSCTLDERILINLCVRVIPRYSTRSARNSKSSDGPKPAALDQHPSVRWRLPGPPAADVSFASLQRRGFSRASQRRQSDPIQLAPSRLSPDLSTCVASLGLSGRANVSQASRRASNVWQADGTVPGYAGWLASSQEISPAR